MTSSDTRSPSRHSPKTTPILFLIYINDIVWNIHWEIRLFVDEWPYLEQFSTHDWNICCLRLFSATYDFKWATFRSKLSYTSFCLDPPFGGLLVITPKKRHPHPLLRFRRRSIRYSDRCFFCDGCPSAMRSSDDSDWPVHICWHCSLPWFPRSSFVTTKPTDK